MKLFTSICQKLAAPLALPFLLIFLTSTKEISPQQLPPHPEYQVKAAFIYNFTGFIQWPDTAFESPTAPFVIGIYGEDPFGKYIDELVAGEHVHGHPVIVNRIESAEDFGRCHLVFINARRKDTLRDLLLPTRSRPILTVSDHAEFAESGGMIRLYTEQNHIRLLVNVKAINAAHLRVSAKLLSVAELVEEKK